MLMGVKRNQYACKRPAALTISDGAADFAGSEILNGDGGGGGVTGQFINPGWG